MVFIIPNQTLTFGALPAPTGTLDFHNYFPGSPGGSAITPVGTGAGFSGSWMVFYNNTDYALQITFPVTSKQFFIPPGFQTTYPLPFGEINCTFITLYRNAQQNFITSILTAMIVDRAEIDAGLEWILTPVAIPPTGQQRSISIPPGIASIKFVNKQLTATGITNGLYLGDATVGALPAVGIGMGCYLYWFTFQVSYNAAFDLVYHVTFVQLNAGGVIQGSTDVYEIHLARATPTANTTAEFSIGAPITFGTNVVANATRAGFDIYLFSGTLNLTVYAQCGATVDTTTQGVQGQISPVGSGGQSTPLGLVAVY